MKTAVFAGFAIALAAGASWAGEIPVSAPAVWTAGIEAPTPLTPPPLAASAAARFVSPIPPSRPLRLAYPGRYPMTVYNPYHPHWVIEVFGR